MLSAMAEKKEPFGDLESERTARWVEHEKLQTSVRRWKLALMLLPLVVIGVLLWLYG